MADRPVGAAKIVLSLDPTNLEKQLVSINDKLTSGMASIDAAYKAIGTKSGPAFEAMKANATAAMNAIAARAGTSAEEVVRVQQAAALKIQNITEQQYKAQEAARAKFQTSSAAYWTAEMKFEAEARAKMQAESAAYWTSKMKFEAEARAKMQAESAAYWTSKMKLEADTRAKMQASSAAYWTAEMKFEAEARAKANAANAEYWLTKKKFDADAKKEAEAASKAPWQTLGIQSVEAINQQKEAVRSAYNEITKSADLSHRDIVNLERAKNEKLKALQNEMSGHHEMSMAAMMRAVLRFYAAWYVASTAVNFVATPFEKGFKAVEDFNTAVASSAAMVMSFSEKQSGVDIADQWKSALKYSRDLVPVLEQIAARTLLSGREVTALNSAFAAQGVFLNSKNKDQVEAFSRVANALPLMTQGSEIMRQINTEIRSLMQGTNESTSSLLRNLKEMDPDLEKNLKTWREQNTVLENIGRLLVGFGYSTSILEVQWQAVKSTLDTTVTKILREGMLGAYPEIIKKAQELNDYLEKNGDHLSKIFGNVASVMASAAGYIVDLFIAADKVLTLASKLSGFKGESFSDYSNRMFKDAFGEESTALISAHGNALKMAAAHGKDYVESMKGAYKDPEALKYLKSLEQEISLIGLTEVAKEKLQAREKGLRGEQLKTAEDLIDQKHALLNEEEAKKDLAKFEEDRLKKISEANRKAGEEAKKRYEREEKSITDYIDKLQLEIDSIGISEQAKERLQAREKGLTGDRLKSVDAMIAQKHASTAAWRAAGEANAAIEADDRQRVASVEGIIAALREEARQLHTTARERVAYSITSKGGNSDDVARALEAFDKITAAKNEASAFTDEVGKLTDKMKDLGNAGKSFGDSISSGINNAIISFKDLLKSYDSINAAQELRNKLSSGQAFDTDATKDIEMRKKATEELSKFEQNSTENQIAAYRQVFGTASQLFKENSRERKAMSALEQGLAAIEIALELKKVAVSVAGYFTKSTAAVTAASVENAANASTALTGAVASTTAQGSVPGAGFAMVAAMAAIMAGVLSQIGVGFGGGGSGSSVATKPTATNYSGTVLGDITASSESMINVTDLLDSIHADEYPELQGIHREMIELNNNITGLVSSIVQNGGTFEGITTSTIGAAQASVKAYSQKVFDLVFNGPSPIANISNQILFGGVAKIGQYLGSALAEGIFGGSTKTWTTGAGLQLGSASISDMVNGGGMDVNTYADYRTKKSGGWFGKTKWSDASTTGAADEDTQRLFTTVFSGLSDTVVSIGESLGTDFEKVKAYVWDIGKIDLMNLTGEEINEKLQAVISTAADTAAGALFEGIKQYQQVGEGLYETASRLVVDKEVVLSSLEAIGKGFAGFANSMDAVAFSESLLTMAGDLEAFTANVSGYFTAFFTETEQALWTTNQFTASLGNIGLVMPTARAGFRDLVDAIDLTTDAGKQMFVSLMSISDMADDVYSRIEELKKSADSIDESLTDNINSLILSDKDYQRWKAAEQLQDTLTAIAELGPDYAYLGQKAQEFYDLQLQGIEGNSRAQRQQNATGLLDRSVDAYLSGLQDSASAANQNLTNAEAVLRRSFTAAENAVTAEAESQASSVKAPSEAAQALADTLKGVVSSFESARKTMAAPEWQQDQSYRSSQKQLFAALVSARSGDFASAKSVSENLGVFTQDNQNLFASSTDYKRDYWKTYNAIAEMEKLSGAQLNESERTVKAISISSEQAQASAEAQIASLGRQLDALLGVDNSVMSLEDAIKQYEDAKAAALAADTRLDEQTTSMKTMVDRLTGIDTSTTSIAAAVTEFLAAYGREGESVSEIPGFAAGGYHDGGWRVVGENGPEIESTGPAFISPMIPSGKDVKELIGEVRALRRQQEVSQYYLVKHAQKTAKLLDKFDSDGMPAERTV